MARGDAPDGGALSVVGADLLLPRSRAAPGPADLPLGVAPRWVQTFDELYFAADNPWIRLSERLHRPGVVRTNERLEALIHDAGALYRSAYYNEWMRPQGFKYTIGNTLLAGDGVVANITLLRPGDMPTFDDAEVRAFDVLSRHLTRALQMGVRLERAENAAAGTAAFDALPQAIALVDGRRRLVYANAAMEALLTAAAGLALRQGILCATDAAAEHDLSACTRGRAGAGRRRCAGDCAGDRAVARGCAPEPARHAGRRRDGPLSAGNAAGAADRGDRTAARPRCRPTRSASCTAARARRRG